MMLVLVGAPTARADGAKLTLSGFIDTGIAWSDPAPPGGVRSGSTAYLLDREPTVNLSSLAADLSAGGFRARLALGTGTALEELHRPEPSLPAPSAVWRYLLEAQASYTIPVGGGLTIAAGLMPGTLGFEAFSPRDNASATHSLMREGLPFVQSGVRVTYRFGEHASAQLSWLNGWRLTDEDRSFRSAAAQLAWRSPLVRAAVNVFAGPARVGDDHDYRVAGEAWAELHPVPALRLAAVFDAGVDPRPDGKGQDTWSAIGVWLRFAIDRLNTVAIRSDFLDDRDGGLITHRAQRLAEVTVTDEINVGPVQLRIEGRIDRSTEAIFGGGYQRELLLLTLSAGF